MFFRFYCVRVMIKLKSNMRIVYFSLKNYSFGKSPSVMKTLAGMLFYVSMQFLGRM